MIRILKYEITAPDCPRVKPKTSRCGQRTVCQTCKDFGGIYLFDNAKIVCNYKYQRKCKRKR